MTLTLTALIVLVFLLARPVADWLVWKSYVWFPRTSRFTSRRGASPRLPESRRFMTPASFSGE